VKTVVHIGSRLIEATAKKLTEDFFKKFAKATEAEK
jgi:carbon monoxide dehydrogenase subunit G